ncbi:MAG: hypothetical protein JST26_09760 [Bacteroidetes bacterium]|nr:hypothetical protein [Bacteroidota bacterium]
MERIFASDGVNSLLKNNHVPVIGYVDDRFKTYDMYGIPQQCTKVEFSFVGGEPDVFLFIEGRLSQNCISMGAKEPYILDAYQECIRGRADVDAFVNIVVTEYLRFQLGFDEYRASK